LQVPSDSPHHQAEPAPLVLARQKARILVVDDDPGIRALCSAVLGAEGYDVTEAADGREGFERAVTDDPDLLLLDIKMPVLDGFELAVALRRDARTRHLPFVFVTGEAEPDVQGHAFSVGALGFFAKPFEPSALTELVRRLLEQLNPPAKPS
jgi:two-component system, chemotaxis family, chemotaxis protein CheY